jgi:hypothetical protein
MSLITSDARSATGRAVGDAIVLRLPAAGFRALIDSGFDRGAENRLRDRRSTGAQAGDDEQHRAGAVGQAPATGAKGAMKTQDLRELHPDHAGLVVPRSFSDV